MPAGFGFDHGEDIGRAAALILVILFGDVAGCRRAERPRFLMQQDRFFIQANDRLGRIIRLFIQRQDIFHALDAGLIEFRHALHFFRPV